MVLYATIVLKEGQAEDHMALGMDAHVLIKKVLIQTVTNQKTKLFLSDVWQSLTENFSPQEF